MIIGSVISQAHYTRPRVVGGLQESGNAEGTRAVRQSDPGSLVAWREAAALRGVVSQDGLTHEDLKN